MIEKTRRPGIRGEIGRKVDSMNKEAVPLIVGLMIPLLLLGVLAVRWYGLDIIGLLQSVDPLYYIVMFPIALGLVIALVNRGE
jgi:hypothetical protein